MKNPIRVFYSELSGRFYASQHDQATAARQALEHAIEQALTEARQAGERAGLEQAAGMAESMCTPNIAHAIRAAVVKESLTTDHLVDEG